MLAPDTVGKFTSEWKVHYRDGDEEISFGRILYIETVTYDEKTE
jgi:hypothetical protein